MITFDTGCEMLIAGAILQNYKSLQNCEITSNSVREIMMVDLACKFTRECGIENKYGTVKCFSCSYETRLSIFQDVHDCVRYAECCSSGSEADAGE